MPASPPPQIAALNHWVAYKAVPGKKPGKIDKIPISPLLGTLASTADPGTWGSYQAAVDRAEFDNLAGVGFVFTNSPYAGVDLDHCVDTNGDIEPWAQQVIDALDSYTEISPSGTGVHILIEATLPQGRRRTGKIEMYDTGRYFTITGNQVDGMPADVMRRQTEIDALHAAVFGTPVSTAKNGNQTPLGNVLDDADILDLARQATNGAKFATLFDQGDIAGYPSPSEADQALCNLLAFWYGKDAPTMDRLFRQSALMRPKWDEKRGGLPYGKTTIEKAIQDTTNTYAGASANTTKPTKTRATTRRITSDVLLAEVASMGYTFRVNDMTDLMEAEGTEISDTKWAEIRTHLRDRGFRNHLAAAEDAILADAGLRRYHPVREYLRGLHWDGGSHVAALACYFPDSESVFPLYLRKWLIGCIARALADPHDHRAPIQRAQNAMLVMDGEQDTGKSYFAAWICPNPNWFTDSPIMPDSKDCILSLTSRWVWEAGELGAVTRRADREALKAFLSRETVTVRPPYGHFTITKPALTNFIGTLNNEAGFLNDPTGSRRFNVTTIRGIDHGYKDDIDRDQVWAEAVAAYYAGEAWRLTKDESQHRGEINQKYEVSDPIEDYLTEMFTITHDPADFTPSGEILDALKQRMSGTTHSISFALGSTMRRLKMGQRVQAYYPNKGKTVWGYRGIK